MKIFDTLSSFEQNVLKCGSVIGDNYLRSMLGYVMNCQPTSRRLGEAIQKLFEVGILGCAQGDFERNESNIMILTRVARVRTSQDNLVICYCKFYPIADSCLDLPKYASCGYLRFKIPKLRETIYKLLTDAQSMELHSKAVKYLQNKTRRCRKCGSGYFTKIMGRGYNMNLGRKLRHERFEHQNNLMSSTTTMEAFEKTTTGSSRLISANLSAYSMRHSNLNLDNNQLKTEEERRNTRISSSPFKTANKLTDNSLLRPFSDANFIDCECEIILENMYRQLIEHCEASEQFDKWLHAILEYSLLCIDMHNAPLALKLLNNALDFIDQKYETLVDPGELWKVPIFKAKALAIMGNARLEMGQLKVAFHLLESSLKCYGYKFPSKMSIKRKIMKCQQYWTVYTISRYRLGTKTGFNAEFCDNVSNCLASMCKIYMFMDMWNNAEIAAIWSLKKALESEHNFPTIINAFSNVISVAMHNSKHKLLTAMESRALIYCTRYKAAMEISDLRAVQKLYVVIFKSRLMQALLTKCIQIGNHLIRISNSMDTKLHSFDILPIFIQALMLQNKVLEIVAIVLDMEYTSFELQDSSGTIWFYVSCIGFQLDTGYIILPFRKCLKYLSRVNLNRVENSALQRYYVVIWLWYLRNEQFEDAELWENKIRKTIKIAESETVVNLFSYLYYFEGLIISLTNKIDGKDHTGITKTQAEIDLLIKMLNENAKTQCVISPRLFHLKAFYRLTRWNDTGHYSLLNKGRKLALRHENIFDELWINHSMIAWEKSMPTVEVHFWREHADNDILDYRELENNDGKLGFYTLEPPLYKL